MISMYQSSVNPPACPRCKTSTPRLHRWQRFSDGGVHIREDCLSCGRFCRWAPKTPPNIDRADRGTNLETRAELADLFAREVPSW